MIWIRIGANYLIPFIVASIGYLSPLRVRPETPASPAYAISRPPGMPALTEAPMTMTTQDLGAPPQIPATVSATDHRFLSVRPPTRP